MRRNRTRMVLATLLIGTVMPTGLTSAAQAAPVGQGFNVTAKDLSFILKQIKISEQHATNPARTADNPCAGLLGSGPDQIPAEGQGVELPWGLRTVDGSCNNLLAGKEYFGTAGKAFPTLVPPVKKPAESGDVDGPFGPAPNGPTSYEQTSGFVIDSQPRVISNLIADQTATNPAAVEAAGAGAEVDPTTGTLSIPNVAPDVGLSAPYNSWFTLFGQFFDHGLDLTGKGGRGTVFMPLKIDDPLYVEGSRTNFMVLTRATTDANGNAINATSSFVDQSQTYASHPSHQVFLREYANDTAGKPQATGGLITGPGGGMANWDAVQEQAKDLLGINLVDTDVFSVPLLATDPYGKFTRGPNGYPQLVTTTGLVEGNPDAPITTANAVKSGGAFLDDISHFATPGLVDHDRNPGTAKQPAVPDTDQGTTNDNDAATYDDEMLGAHFMAGDGRVNENIGLTAVHHVFHAEHNRLVDESDPDDPSDLKTVIKDYVATNPTNPLFTLADWQRPDGQWDGERLFQAAKFVTEMEYQHLAFEEFARKVQPGINLFGEGGTGYNTSINPSVRGEFANAVYRFGHSMLTETVDRVGPGATNLPLLEAFLNPPAFMTGTQTPEQAAGNIVRGMTRQVGAEIDEFVTDALRNELLGLPLDLPALNIARARETGTPTLNAARRAFFATSNNSALTPYDSWADFQFSIRNPGSLVNFIAAYGTHDSITEATTRADKRNAANALLYGANGPDGQVDTDDDIPATSVPEDRYAFLNSAPHETTDPDTGVTTQVHTRWVSGGDGVTTTGVDTIDLWMGGLAERQQVFGGLLGPTFNFVFEKQMEDLQNGDRFYYLSRTVSQNLLVQLEGNSFAELISRNTDVSGLPADSFSRPDFIFDVSKLGTSGPILDDPDTTYNEAQLLTRMSDGTIRYGKVPGAHVVFNGTAGNDRMWSGEGDDTVRGNDGNDRIQGGDGNDSLIGGLGDDIIQDLNGDDTLKGGDGNDVLSSGQGAGGDLNQGGRGNDFILGGNDITESFAGQGDDFVYAGDADDTVFGDEGNDWIEGGLGNFNLLQGDNGAPFQDDALGGHDVLIGYGGEQDYDAEGGDDIMLAGPGLQRAEGMLGFDWFTHTKDPTLNPDSDMAFTGLLPPGVETNRDRMDLVESLSGYNQNDILRGDNRDAAAMIGHELNAAGIARIDGLSGLLPPRLTADGEVAAATSFTGGNIIIGGAGSDTIEGRGGNDVIDGDAYLNVRISVRDASGNEIDSVDTMAGVQARVLAGTINPGQLQAVREILTPGNGAAVDVAVFSGPLEDYTIEGQGDRLTVTHVGGTDGTDTVRNVETLRFADQDVDTASLGQNTPATGAVTVSDTTPARGQVLTATSSEVTDPDGVGPITYTWERETAPDTWTVVGTGDTYAPVAADVGARLRAAASFVDGAGNNERLVSEPTAAVIDVPGPPTIGTATAGDASATVTWTAPASNGGAAITEYRIQARGGGNGNGVVQVSTSPSPIPGNATSAVVTGLTNGVAYTFAVAAVNDAGAGAFSAESNAVTPAAPSGGEPDTTAPMVTAQTPAPGATGVARRANITATFNEAVVGVSTTTFTLQAGAGPVIAGRVTYDAGTRVATFRPNGSLLRNTTYTATLTSGITDAAGNVLSPVTWSFTTGR